MGEWGVGDGFETMQYIVQDTFNRAKMYNEVKCMCEALQGGERRSRRS